MADANERKQKMTESGWIIRDALGRAMEEYRLSHAELAAVVLEELSGWTKQQLAEEWGQ